jgi:hypothetical protein
MPRRLLPFVLLALALASADPLPAQQKGKGKGKPADKGKAVEPPYFPLEVGTHWVYKAGPRSIDVRVVKHETVAGVPCARLEAASEGADTHVEYVAVRPDGVYKYRADGQDINPPLCFLKLPPKAVTTWETKAEVGGLDLHATFTLGRAEITVPAGTYKAVTAGSPDFTLAGRTTPVAYWFAPGVGLVRQRVEMGRTEVVLELQRFEKPKK